MDRASKDKNSSFKLFDYILSDVSPNGQSFVSRVPLDSDWSRRYVVSPDQIMVLRELVFGKDKEEARRVLNKETIVYVIRPYSRQEERNPYAHLGYSRHSVRSPMFPSGPLSMHLDDPAELS